MCNTIYFAFYSDAVDIFCGDCGCKNLFSTRYWQIVNNGARVQTRNPGNDKLKTLLIHIHI